MTIERPSRPFATFQRFAQRATEATQERCELCSEPIGREHRHLLELATRQTVCVCRACSILFDREAASNGRYRLIPDRRLFLADFQMSDAQWDSLRIPVGIAFFVPSTAAGRVTAFYPGPMGQMESLLNLDTWHTIEQDNPPIAGLCPDVEALLVNRARGAQQHFLVPIEDCFRLVGVIRMNWRGLSGGQEVWKEIARFFETLQQRAKTPAAPAGSAGVSPARAAKMAALPAGGGEVT